MGKVMNKELCEKFLELVEEKTDVGFSVNEQHDGTWLIEGEYWSDLGEDVIISLVVDELDIEEIAHKMYECAENFDAEEHASEWYNMHGEHGAPTSMRALLEDADEQQEKLNEIYEAMRSYLEFQRM